MPRLLVYALAALAFACTAACGGGGEADPTPSPEPTVTVRPRANATPEPEATVGVTAPVARPTPRCPDPYAAGAPYEPTPGDPIRLRPNGSAGDVAAYVPIPFTRNRDLEAALRYLIGGDAEHFSIVVKNLDDGSGATIQPDRSYYAASLYKTWAMLEAFHQRDAGLLGFDEELIVSDYYEALGLNAGEIEACEHVTVSEAMAKMMSYSDNVAANLVLDRVGVWNVNLALLGLGLEHSGFVDGSLPTTAGDMALLLEAIAEGGALSEADSAGMLALLESEVIDNRIPALLPPNTRVAHKTGSWDSATHDAGIVFSPKARYVIVVLTDLGYTDGGAGRIATISKAVYGYYNR